MIGALDDSVCDCLLFIHYMFWVSYVIKQVISDQVIDARQ